MHAFHIRYRNTQGTLMRILNAASRRALDLPSVHAEAAGDDHLVTVLLDVNAKQVGQLNREWYSITDVIEVRESAGLREDGSKADWTSAHPPTSESAPGQSAHAALA